MKIICGTDFSDNAKAGATVAAALAGKLRDRLLLVHALPGGGQGAVSPEVMNSSFANLHEVEVLEHRKPALHVIEPLVVSGAA